MMTEIEIETEELDNLKALAILLYNYFLSYIHASYYYYRGNYFDYYVRGS